MEKMFTHKLGKYDGSGDDVPVPSATNDAWSQSLKIDYAHSFCVSMRAKSATGTPDIDVYLEQTHINPDSVTTGEGVIGDTDNAWVQAVGASKLADLTTEAWVHFTVSPVVLPYLRFLFDPQGSNPADCTVEVQVTVLEEI
jgi:hypothetical protein